ncbi:MAG TPA: hydroxymethylglutaryl-CoA reductase [Longimicrobium sp.]
MSVLDAPAKGGEALAPRVFVPAMLLRQLYTFGSLRNTGDGFELALKNRLRDVELTLVATLRIDGREIGPDRLTLHLAGGEELPARDVSELHPLPFPLGAAVTVEVENGALDEGKHEIELSFACEPFGDLTLAVEDALSVRDAPGRVHIPRDPADDYGPAAVLARQRFAAEFSGHPFDHVAKFSFDAHAAVGNCEHFTGVAQVPLGIAGPLHVDGEHAQGEFLIPLATSEGTLVASYNRGMQVLNESGGVKCTVEADAMQRAPVFVFDDARRAREFTGWVGASMDQIRAAAESTSSVARLVHVETYLASKFAYLRFNFTTGDAAGQNMVSRATCAACAWIAEHFRGIRRFYLEANLATDKKASHVNLMRTRGKRVTAEVTIPREVLIARTRAEPEALVYHYGIANVGAMLAGANNNGLHAANAVTAMFIACGQDVANVAESSAGIVYTELTPERDLYISLTLPSLIVATHGGGTGLPTQRECLELMGCWGKGKVNKLAEIVAGVALAGEVSLAAAISAQEWVSSHERYGRHR